MDVFNKYVGQVFDGRYKIEGTVGVGGMAIVFEATDLLTNRKVAVKMLKDSVSGNTQAIKRFIIESKAVAMLNHENIVKIYDISVRGEHKYIVMEFLEGITLREYMKNKGPLSWRETVEFTEQILAALDHAHMKGVVHRDIKPQNIMLLEGGFVKVTAGQGQQDRLPDGYLFARRYDVRNGHGQNAVYSRYACGGHL